MFNICKHHHQLFKYMYLSNIDICPDVWSIKVSLPREDLCHFWRYILTFHTSTSLHTQSSAIFILHQQLLQLIEFISTIVQSPLSWMSTGRRQFVLRFYRWWWWWKYCRIGTVTLIFTADALGQIRSSEHGEGVKRRDWWSWWFGGHGWRTKLEDLDRGVGDWGLEKLQSLWWSSNHRVDRLDWTRRYLPRFPAVLLSRENSLKNQNLGSKEGGQWSSWSSVNYIVPGFFFLTINTNDGNKQ